MKKLIMILCIIVPLMNYAQEVIYSDSGIEAMVELVGEEGHQFTLTDEDYPPFYPDPETAGYSYMWHTDEGHISNEDNPVFFFASEGLHNVYLTLTPRKKGEEFLKVFTTFIYDVDILEISDASHGDITEVNMYVDGEARFGDKVYVVVPLNSCSIPAVPGTIHNYKVGYDHTKLKYLGLLSQSNLDFNAVLTESSTALGIPLNRKISFSYDWNIVRDDIAVVIEFEVKTPDVGEPIGLKFEKEVHAACDCDVEINFSTISGPYDPNYKESDITEVNVYENPDKKVNPSEVLYTIHFQNIGDGEVDSVTITDVLPSYLTFVSFEGSSEPAITNTSHVSGTLKWIMSPDADIKGTNQSPTQPEPSTKGWVSFKAEISKEEDIMYDTCYCLENVATIYFDSLAPITTEANIIVIGDSLCFSPDPNAQGELYAETICGSGATSGPSSRKKATSINKNSSFIAYPNPSNEAFQLKGELDKIQQIEVLNSLGQRVLFQSKYNGAINLDDQPNGLYFIRILTEEEQQVIRFEKAN